MARGRELSILPMASSSSSCLTILPNLSWCRVAEHQVSFRGPPVNLRRKCIQDLASYCLLWNKTMMKMGVSFLLTTSLYSTITMSLLDLLYSLLASTPPSPWAY